MLKYIKEYRFYITLFLFILIPIVAIDTATRRPNDYRLYDKAIVAITSPIQAVITLTLDQIVSGFQNYVYLWNTRRDNSKLLEENRKLLNLIAELREAERENGRLRQLLDFEEKFELETVTARVIAKDVSTEFRAIRINRGERSGILKGMAVVTNEGIVGRILRTTAQTADVVTILDLLSAVDSIVARSRARGVIEGMTDEVCQLRYVLRTDDITVGDMLVSSGLGGIYPKGLTVGTVSKVDRKPYGISQEVEVRPSVDFSKLEEVMVVTNVVSEPILSKNKKKGKRSAEALPATKRRVSEVAEGQ